MTTKKSPDSLTASGACAGGEGILANPSSPRSTLEVLIAARALIADEKNWCVRYGARDKRGRRAMVKSRAAVQWCALGALERFCSCTTTAEWDVSYVASCRLYAAAQPSTPFHVNDHEGHAATLAMFDRAIEAEKAKAGRGDALGGGGGT